MSEPGFTAIEIENFRGIRRGRIEGLEQISVLVGRNNSGKTTVLEGALISAHYAAARNADVLGRNRLKMIFAGRDEQEDGADASWWHRGDTAVNIGLRLESGGSWQSQTIGWGGGSPALTGASWDDELSIHHALMTAFNPRRAPRSDFEGRIWQQILAGRGDKVLTKLINEVFGLDAEGFHFISDRRVVALFSTYTVPVEGLGDGTRLAFRLLMLVSMLEGTTLLIDELESSQHPGSLERLSKALAEGARARRLQLLITTHSAECVVHLLRAAADKGLGAAVIHCALEEGQLKSRTIPGATALDLLAAGTDPRLLDLYA